MECLYCKSILTTLSALNHHQKSAKYCLKIQGVKNESYVCIYCKDSFSVKSVMDTHLITCKTRKNESLCNLNQELTELKQEIINLKDQNKILQNNEVNAHKTIEDQKQTIKDLQNTIEKLASQAIARPTTSTTKNTQINYIQQMKPVIDDELKDNAQNLTIDHILKGPEGYAQYALEYPLKDRVCCVDYARRKVKFKDPNGNVITDPEMTNLATKFFQSIKDKNKELIIEYGNKLQENFGDEMDTIIQIFDYKLGVQRSSEGEKCDFHHDFVKQICSKTIVE